MGRRRHIHLEYGRVELFNFPKDLADRVEEYLNKFDKNDTTPIVVNNVQLSRPGEMNDKTVTLHFNSKENVYQLVFLEYNSNTKEARVTEVKNIGQYKVDALNQLKLEMFKMGLI